MGCLIDCLSSKLGSTISFWFFVAHVVTNEVDVVGWSKGSLRIPHFLFRYPLNLGLFYMFGMGKNTQQISCVSTLRIPFPVD